MSGRWRGLWRSRPGRVLVVASAFLLPTAGYVFYLRSAENARIEAAWRLSDAAGLPRTMDELLGPEIPFDENAAISIAEAGRKANVWRSEFLQVHAKDLPLTPAGHPKETAFFADRAQADDEFENAMQRADSLPRYRSIAQYPPPSLDPPPEIEHLSSLYFVERNLFRRLNDRGKPDEGVRHLLRALRIVGKVARHEPLIWTVRQTNVLRERLLQLLSEPLYVAQLPDRTHDEIETTVAALDSLGDEIRRAMQTEKISYIATRSQLLSAFGRSLSLANDDLSWGLAKAWEVQQSYELPRPAALPLLKRIKDAATSVPSLPFARRRISASWLVYPLLDLRTDFDHTLALARAARILNALAQRKTWTAPLESLGLPPHVLVDPYTDKPMRVKQTPDGPIVYSLGPNLVDEEGEDSSPGAARPFGDVGVRPPARKPVVENRP